MSVFILLLFIFKKGKVAVLIIASFLFGVFYYQHFAELDFVLPLFEGREVELTARVVDEESSHLEVKDFRDLELSERVAVYIDGDLKHGQVVKIKGEPNPIEGEFENHFHTENVSVSFFDPEIKIVGNDYSLISYIYSARRSLGRRISRSSQFPESALLKALLLGDRSSIPDSLQDRFSEIGIAHLLAVSGTHIVIVSGIIVSFISLLGIKFKYLLSIVFISGFVLLVGAPISAIRAGLIGSLFILAQKIGRKKNSSRGLILIAFLMLLLNPRLLSGSVSFQLSFLAALGISLFSGRLKSFLTEEKVVFKKSKINEIRNGLARIFKRFSFLTDTLAVTLSAQIFTLPLIYYHFGNLPFLAPVSNLVIAPIVPVLMIVGFLSLLFSFIIPSTLAFLPAYIISTTTLFLTEILHLACFLC